MSTKLTRSVTRETADVDPVWGDTLMVKLEVGGKILRVWRKGRRTRYTVTYADVWRWAFQRAVAEAEKARRAERKARRSKKVRS